MKKIQKKQQGFRQDIQKTRNAACLALLSEWG